MIRRRSGAVPPKMKVAVCEPGGSPPGGWLECELQRDIRFSPAALESYACSKWEPVIFDAMLVAASVEFTDLSCRRPSLGWPRRLSIRIPVDDPDRWEAPAVKDSLRDAIAFVTGDHWSIRFFKRTEGLENSAGDRLRLFPPSKAVLAYSEGMDSLAVAGLAKACLGDDVVRVRLGGKGDAKNASGRPFVSVPYRVSAERREATGMSRGFKFAMISGLAAYLTGANKIIVPESGQGALGPPLVSVGHAYHDHRNHPRFTRRMERFLGSASRTAHPLLLPPPLVHQGGNPCTLRRDRRRRDLAVHQVLLARQSLEFCPRIVAPLWGLRCVYVEARERSRGRPLRRPGNLCLH